MTAWRLLADDGAGAAAGLATDESLMSGYAAGAPERPTAIRLYTYASHCALVGRYQSAEAEVDLEACRRTGTAVNRRPTGGGAIVMGAGQLGVAVVGRAPAAERPKETIVRLSEGIVRGLAEVGVAASFGGKNDLEVQGRKIAGLGLYVDGRGAMLFHSSVLADLDIGFMLSVLRIPAAKLGDKGVAAVAQRVTTVTRCTGQPWTGAALRNVVAAGFEKAFGAQLVPSELTGAECDAAESLRRTKYDTADWLMQRSAPGAQGTALCKTPSGLVRVHVAVDGAVISSVLFTGDFNELPPELGRLEAALKWSRAERAPGVVARVLGTSEVLPVAALTAAVTEAVDRASRRAVSAPDREGSCYFPEVG